MNIRGGQTGFHILICLDFGVQQAAADLTPAGEIQEAAKQAADAQARHRLTREAQQPLWL
jgi:hypothetical protein